MMDRQYDDEVAALPATAGDQEDWQTATDALIGTHHLAWSMPLGTAPNGSQINRQLQFGPIRSTVLRPVLPQEDSAADPAGLLHRYNVDYGLQPMKIVGVARVEPGRVCVSGCCDEQVHRAGPWLTPGVEHRSGDLPVARGHGLIER